MYFLHFAVSVEIVGEYDLKEGKACAHATKKKSKTQVFFMSSRFGKPMCYGSVCSVEERVDRLSRA